jgi:hypothetical protein
MKKTQKNGLNNLAPHGARLTGSTSKALFFIVFIGNYKIGSSCSSTTYRLAEGVTLLSRLACR